jgi:hypothetical protein
MKQKLLSGGYALRTQVLALRDSAAEHAEGLLYLPEDCCFHLKEIVFLRSDDLSQTHFHPLVPKSSFCFFKMPSSYY